MKKVVLFFVLVLAGIGVHAQGFIWAQAFQQIGLNKMLLDDSDNMYTVGSFQGMVDANPDTNATAVYNLTCVGQSNLAIIKQDSAGNFLWAKQIKGRLWAPSSAIIYPGTFTTDKAGNLYLSGAMNDSFDFDPGTNDYWIGSSSGDYFYFILKLTKNGDFIWAKSFHATNANSSIGILDFAVKDSRIYITGGITGTVDIDPGPDTVNAWPIMTPGAGFIEMLDTAGHYHWIKQINGPNYLGDVIADSDGNLFVRYSFQNSIDVDPGSAVVMMTATPNNGVFAIEKFDSSGNYQWAEIIGVDNGWYQWSTWKIDHGNNIMVTGYYYGTVDFDPSPAVHQLTTTNGDKMFLLKLSNGGNFVWVKEYNCREGDDFTFDSLWNIYTLGPIVSNGSYTGAYTQKLDSLGNHKWDITTSAQYLYPYSILLNHSNKLLTLGSFQGTNADLDPTTGTSLFSTPFGNSNAASFIQKLCLDTFHLTLSCDTNFTCATLPAHLTATYYPGVIYHWVKDGLPTSTSTSNIDTIYTSGNYRVEVTGIGNCTTVSDTTINITSVAPQNCWITLDNSFPAYVTPGMTYYLWANVHPAGGNYTIIWTSNGVPFDTTYTNSTSYIKSSVDDTIKAYLFVPCSGTFVSNIKILYTTSSVSEIPSENNFFLTPNPAKDVVTIQTLQSGSLEISDLTGRTALQFKIQSPTSKIDINSLDVGVYVYRFVTNDGQTTQGKLVIVR